MREAAGAAEEEAPNHVSQGYHGVCQDDSVKSPACGRKQQDEGHHHRLQGLDEQVRGEFPSPCFGQHPLFLAHPHKRNKDGARNNQDCDGQSPYAVEEIEVDNSAKVDDAGNNGAQCSGAGCQNSKAV